MLHSLYTANILPLDFLGYEKIERRIFLQLCQWKCPSAFRTIKVLTYMLSQGQVSAQTIRHLLLVPIEQVLAPLRQLRAVEVYLAAMRQVLPLQRLGLVGLGITMQTPEGACSARVTSLRSGRKTIRAELCSEVDPALIHLGNLKIRREAASAVPWDPHSAQTPLNVKGQEAHRSKPSRRKMVGERV